MTHAIEHAKNAEATVYEYRGKGATSDALSKVKAHHAEAHGANYNDLSARKIGSGTTRSGVRIRTVVVVDGGGA